MTSLRKKKRKTRKLYKKEEKEIIKCGKKPNYIEINEFGKFM